VRVCAPLALWLLSAAALEAQSIPGTVWFADGRQLSGRVAFSSATFVQGRGITDATGPTDTLHFRPDSAITVALSSGDIRTIEIRYIPAGHGLLRRAANIRTTTVGQVEGSIPVWHEAPAGPSRLVFTRYVTIESPSGESSRIELADRDDIPYRDRVVAVEFAGPVVPKRAHR